MKIHKQPVGRSMCKGAEGPAERVSLEVGHLAPFEPSDDCVPSQHVDGNLKPQHPCSVTLGHLMHRDCEIINMLSNSVWE